MINLVFYEARGFAIFEPTFIISNRRSTVITLATAGWALLATKLTLDFDENITSTITLFIAFTPGPIVKLTINRTFRETGGLFSLL
jgi:hypothetical protein